MFSCFLFYKMWMTIGFIRPKGRIIEEINTKLLAKYLAHGRNSNRVAVYYYYICVSHRLVHFCVCAHVLYKRVSAWVHDCSWRRWQERQNETLGQAVWNGGFESLCTITLCPLSPSRVEQGRASLSQKWVPTGGALTLKIPQSDFEGNRQKEAGLPSNQPLTGN